MKFDMEGFVKDINSCYLFEKEGKFQEVIHLLKYQGMKTLGIMLGQELGKRIATDPSFCGADYLIPIPLHKLKQRERGYNQSEYICKGVLAASGIPVHDSIIHRKKYTQSQTQLNLQERIENVGDAFEVNQRFKSLVPGKSFILVDDVITTGSTINACAKELINLNAHNVFAASVALAQ
ncbi:MAG: phosphoribosyltransferase family protein [Bacteroidota bacterium]|nr:phosphoribosyltransferase family protein [Bacteroidota bacterium]